jgi:hypothetical protein
MALLRRLYAGLKLQINEAKSAVASKRSANDTLAAAIALC